MTYHRELKAVEGIETDGVCAGGEKGYRKLLLYVIWRVLHRMVANER